MPVPFATIAFTPAVKAAQSRYGSREAYAGFERDAEEKTELTEREAGFIAKRDSFYQATVSETGWPYVQHRGGPVGFLKVLDGKTIGYADFRGNVQYVSVGNLEGNDRISIILMDYANKRRLKILGRVRLVNESDDPALIARLELPNYRARVERAVVITVEAYDWNCPQHITPRFSEVEVEAGVALLRAEIAQSKQALGRGEIAAVPLALGSGPLALRISGIRQLTSRVRAYELRGVDSADLPPAQAGAHIDLPVRLKHGVTSTRRYSISSNPQRRDAYEVAVLREDAGSGGSAAVHADYQLGMTLNCDLPGNDFALHSDDRPVVLIAGGIGITPIKTMAQQLWSEGRRVELHYAVRSGADAPYLDCLEQKFGASMRLYAADQQQRMDLSRVISQADPNTVFYVCGPARLIDAARSVMKAAGLDKAQIRFERFVAAPSTLANQPITVLLTRSGKHISVATNESILDAVLDAGVPALASCRAGTCGTCRVKVLGGEPEHRDSALEDFERNELGLMCICVSRAKSAELTLDL